MKLSHLCETIQLKRLDWILDLPYFIQSSIISHGALSSLPGQQSWNGICLQPPMGAKYLCMLKFPAFPTYFHILRGPLSNHCTQLYAVPRSLAILSSLLHFRLNHKGNTKNFQGKPFQDLGLIH